MKILLSLFIATVALMSSGSALAADSGHCNYTQENMFAGPFKVCDMPTADSAACDELGNADDNADPVFEEGPCPTEDAVGTCDMGETKRVYYEGDPNGLEIGCGFSSGEWSNAE
jgi:hypothetical protein